MNPFLLLVFCATCVLAAPYDTGNDVFDNRQSSYLTSKQPIVPILKQIQQLNDDGSYTFGYEAADGTFRVEKKDSVGYVTGKYGFYDEYGKLKIVDYVAGIGEASQNLGFQAKGDLVPAIPMKVNRGASPQQKSLDLEYSSVDDNEDGVPDRASSYQIAQPVRVSYQQQRVVQPVVRQEIGGYQQQTVQPVVRLDSSAYQTIAHQPVVRLNSQQTYQAIAEPVVRLENTVYQQESVQPVVRLDSPTYQQALQAEFRQMDKTGYSN